VRAGVSVSFMRQNAMRNVVWLIGLLAVAAPINESRPNAGSAPAQSQFDPPAVCVAISDEAARLPAADVSGPVRPGAAQVIAAAEASIVDKDDLDALNVERKLLNSVLTFVWEQDASPARHGTPEQPFTGSKQSIAAAREVFEAEYYRVYESKGGLFEVDADIDNDGTTERIAYIGGCGQCGMVAPVILSKDLTGVDKAKTLRLLRRPLGLDRASRGADADLLTDAVVHLFRVGATHYVAYTWRIYAPPKADRQPGLRVFLLSKKSARQICSPKT
jgi:hypothetical protein